MTNSQIASALSELGTLLELQGESSFRANAYHMAARTIDQQTEEVAPRILDNTLGFIPGIGSTLREKIESLVRTGSIPQLEELRAAVPAGWLRILRVPGLGPKKVRTLTQNGIEDLPALKEACDQGRVAKIKGFGAKTQENILTGLAFLEQAGSRVHLDVADAMAAELLTVLKQLPSVTKAEICGSLRRRADTIGSLDFVVVTSDAKVTTDAFAALPIVSDVGQRTERLVSAIIRASHQ